MSFACDIQGFLKRVFELQEQKPTKMIFQPEFGKTLKDLLESNNSTGRFYRTIHKLDLSPDLSLEKAKEIIERETHLLIDLDVEMELPVYLNFLRANRFALSHLDGSSIIIHIGTGAEGSVFRIIGKEDKPFVLKVFTNTFETELSYKFATKGLSTFKKLARFAGSPKFLELMPYPQDHMILFENVYGKGIDNLIFSNDLADLHLYSQIESKLHDMQKAFITGLLLHKAMKNIKDVEYNEVTPGFFDVTVTENDGTKFGLYLTENNTLLDAQTGELIIMDLQ